MSTNEIIKEIKLLPVEIRYKIVEQTLKFIQETENRNSLETAADKLLNDYISDKELTIFTNLDFENFYEAK